MRETAILLAMIVAAPAHAQVPEQAGPPRGAPAPVEGWNITVGVAPVLSPAWQGSRDTTLALFPDLRVNYRDILFASVPDGVGWNAVKGGGWRAGPLVKVRFGRDEENGGSPFLVAGGSDALVGMGDVKAAAEPGVFVEKAFGRREQWRVRTELRRGFGGHEGVLADASVSYRARAGRTIVTIGPRMTAASGSFMQTYFGIDAGQAQRTGLARYDANGGILSYGLGGSMIRPLDRRSAVTLFTSLERLGAPASESPLVRERGRPTQFTLGLGYGYRFGL